MTRGAGVTLDAATPEETEAIGRVMGAVLRAGDLLLLDGPLGAGKTVLVRGLAEGWGAPPEVVHSPTFVFHHVYRTEHGPLHHIDLYRLGDAADVTFLDVETLLAEGPVAVEWGSYARLGEWEPATVTIDIPAGGEGRRLTLSGAGELSDRLATALRAGIAS